MNTFGRYATYYNLIYRDKDYAREVGFIHELITQQNQGAKTILDLGCGTGRHDVLLAERGYSVTGVDGSELMIRAAEAARETSRFRAALSFQRGDIRDLRLETLFDVVISLFHVMSYQVSNEDLAASFRAAKGHLKPEGVFIFDFWYGPAVLTDRPSIRIKRLEDERIFVTRLAEPEMHPNRNIVDVNYQILIQDKSDKSVEELTEKHVMRYLFIPEIEYLLNDCGFRFVRAAEWMTGKEPGFDTWSVYCVAKA